MKQIKIIFIILSVFFMANFSYAEEYISNTPTKHPDYACMFLGDDKCENFNRKVFSFNSKLNKYIIKPVDILWASIMPKYGMDRIRGIYNNIEFPKRLISSIIQKDFKGSGRETLRFLTNSTIGLAGMFDPAKTLFKLEPVNENMEQALAKCKCNQGHYLVMPCINGCTPRELCGKCLDTALNPTCYVGTPILALIKLGFTINETAYMQPLADMVESNFADSYDIAKKLYGIENYIKSENLDRTDVIDEHEKKYNTFADNTDGETLRLSKDTSIDNFDVENVTYTDLLKEGITKESYILKHSKPSADISLDEYNAQSPVIDSMRTALFNLPDINDSIWSDLSVWNRSFANRIKTASVELYQGREKYKYRYLLQKNKNAPVVIIFPSIGEGIKSYHSVVFGKMFYDAGYSVLIEGSSFQWEFVKSMPQNYTPGIPSEDAKQLALITKKIISELEDKYKCKFKSKTIIGTSFGAITTLFLANNEYKNNTLNINKYIAINPPIELLYAMKSVDGINQEWQKNPDNLKERVALTTAKILKLWNKRNEKNFNITTLPFNDYEAKLITGFIMHQKLSDLIMTIENKPTNKKSDFYENIYNINYTDYLNKYIIEAKGLKYDDLNYDTSLYSISDYLENNDNYKIYHSLDDYLVNNHQLNMLKKYSKNKSVFLSNGSHLGFLYRNEFIEELKKEIAIN